MSNENCTSIVNVNRSAMEHRATWMSLIYKAGIESGVSPEEIIRKGISDTGLVMGKNLKSMCTDSTDLTQFANALLTETGINTFEVDIVEKNPDSLKLEFHYCPLLEAWKKLGFNEEQCSLLCDITMDGDRCIAKACGIELELTDTLAAGDEVCKLHFHKKKG